MWPFGRRKSVEPSHASSNNSAPVEDTLGRRGEFLARKFLRRARHKILAANYRCPAGEADLIVLDTSTRKTTGQETIVFVEVKTRQDAAGVSPESAVNAAKRDQLRRVARYYLRTRDSEGFALRFDIIAILIPTGQQPQIKHIRDAFRCTKARQQGS